MSNRRDKYVIENWLRLYNRLCGSTFVVEGWPDEDSTKKNVDAICHSSGGRTLAIEHTLIEPFEGEKADSAHFGETLATLEHHPGLLQPGYAFTLSQRVGSTPTDRDEVPAELLRQLPGVLSSIQEGRSSVTIRAATWELPIEIVKESVAAGEPGRVWTSRIWPGDPGPKLILRALLRKTDKLRDAAADLKILLLEKDSIAGTLEHQFEQLPDVPGTCSLLRGIDQVWSVNTVALDSEGVIFANQLAPPVAENANCCSLNLRTGRFWQVQR